MRQRQSESEAKKVLKVRFYIASPMFPAAPILYTPVLLLTLWQRAEILPSIPTPLRNGWKKI